MAEAIQRAQLEAYHKNNINYYLFFKTDMYYKYKEISF